ncbi:MAG: wax ester/triacylglycerol synthase family O-acyltransferase [Solirubrobacteraceae bacterium]|nr:wax ester/triacylglycerol synthase family O-acyltransferase [Solirubrobacteraceae bacterium]
MAQEHLDPLTVQDARLLANEDACVHPVIGTVATFEGPPPEIGALREHIRGRLRVVPRYRQRPAEPPAGLGAPRWVDDPNFNLDYHVRHAALPAPGDSGKLQRMVARLFSQSLDRTKPLWELYVVEGLHAADGGRDRWALISKTHLALVDGTDGIDLLTVMFDIESATATGRVPAHDRWQPRPLPTTAQLAAAALEDRARDIADLPRQTLALVSRPNELAAKALGAAGAVWSSVTPSATAPLNEPIGPHRRFVSIPARLAEFRAIKDALDCSVNDVMLASVAGGLRHWLHQRGARTAGVELSAAVPVSIRVGTEHTGFASQLTQVVAPLPVDLGDAVARVRLIRDVMRGVKRSAGALDADLIAGMADFAPPTILAQASRLGAPPDSYHVAVTNIPGPQSARFVLGRRLESIAPVGFLDAGRPLSVAAMSYDGNVSFGLLADYDALPDIIEIAAGIEASLQELLEHVGAIDEPDAPSERRAQPRALKS